MFTILCGEYEDTRLVEMDGRPVEFSNRDEADLFVKIYNLGCTLNCDRAFVEESDGIVRAGSIFDLPRS